MVFTLRLRQHTRAAAVTLVMVMLAAVAAPAMAATQRWIVPEGTPLPAGSTVVGAFPVADALIVDSPTAPEGGASLDTPLSFRSAGLPAEDEAEDEMEPVEMQLHSGVASTGAPAVWELGEWGEQAVVAVVDTGVAPIAALEGAVAGEINFSGTGRGGDGYGHGTFIASLIAARGPVAPGVAPGAGILSLKVADHEGNASLRSVMSALQWLYATGGPAGIRVATLALGVSPDDEAAELLEAATNAVAERGVLVVTAAGNDGADNLSSPATAAGTYSVGAFDDAGTAEAGDDGVADYSATGPDRVGVQQPDVLASGTNVIGHMPLDSVIGMHNEGARVNGPESELFRGTGTSMSTALVGGVAALASSAAPELTGQQLADVLGMGGGRIDAPAAVAAAVAAQPDAEPADTTPWGDVEHGPGNSTGDGKGKGDGNVNGQVNRSGSRNSQVEPDGLRWTGLRWTGLRWTGLRWTGLRWTGLRWTGLRWTGLRWTGLRWTGLRWTGNGWGDESWAFGEWSGLRWTGSGWDGEMAEPTFKGLRWTGLRWTGLRWTGLRWTGLRWTGLRWTMHAAPAE